MKSIFCKTHDKLEDEIKNPIALSKLVLLLFEPYMRSLNFFGNHMYLINSLINFNFVIQVKRLKTNFQNANLLYALLVCITYLRGILFLIEILNISIYELFDCLDIERARINTVIIMYGD